MVLKLFLFALIVSILVKTPLAWGFSVERAANYEKQARDLNLAHAPQWLRLGHYEKKLLGDFHSKVRGNFFLAVDGADQPEKELLATIRVLFNEPSSISQCRYLSRTKWLSEVLKINPEDLVSCPERTAWKKKLNAREIYLVFAANDVNSAPSSFGHTFLRLHDPNHLSNLDILDYGVNFAAQTDDSDGALFAIKGLFGSYPGFYSMLPFHQKMQDYTNLEGRDLWEYKLNFTTDQVDIIVDHLLELEGSYVPYYFLDENCSYQLLGLIEVARPDLDMQAQFHDGVIPIDTLKVIAAQKNLISGERQRPALKRSFQSNYDRLNSSQKGQIVELADQVKTDEKVPSLAIQDVRVLDTAMTYIDLQDYRGLKNSKDWRYQLALQRSKLGSTGETPLPAANPGSPLQSAGSMSFDFGYGKKDEKDFGQFKFRRAFHDLLSRNEGVAPFSHMELGSFTLRRPLDSGPLDLQELKILKIISTLPVTRLEHPLSWKVDVGTEIKLNPRIEGGGGYSFDVGADGRISSFAVARAFREEERNRYGGGAEIFYLQKLLGGTRSLIWANYLGLGERTPLFESGIALAQDLTRNLELRISYERKFEANEGLLNLMASF